MSSLPDAVQVGDWRVEPELDVLAREGSAIRIEPRAMRVLSCLILRAGHVVTVDELLEQAWPDVVVGPDSVYQAVGLLRRTLGDDRHHPTYIEHVPRKGYRLIARVAAANGATPVPIQGAAAGRAASAVRRYGVWAVVALALSALGVAYLLSSSPQRERPAVSSTTPSIAVLPFLDLSEKQDFGYFADGLTEELIDLLARGSRLRVPARTSSFYFKGKTSTVGDMARALNVDNLLEGSVRRSGNRVRVTAQLIRADNGYHLWSQTYDLELDETFTVEDQIAQAVSHVLQARLSSEGTALQGSEASAEAHNLRLQCQFFVQRNTAPDSAKSVECYQQLLKLDPQDATAWAGYADALWRLHRVADLSPTEDRRTVGASRAAAEHALLLDPTTAAAHAVLATYHEGVERNWSAADSELKAALTADPDDPASLLAAGQLARYLGQLDRAVALLERAARRDPLNFLPYTRLSMIYLYEGKLAEAEVAARRRLDLSPEGLGGYTAMVDVLLAAGRLGEALETAQHEPNQPSRLLSLSLTFFALGNKPQADSVFAELQRKYPDATFPTAEIHAYRGEIDQAFAALERALSSGDAELLTVKTDPYLARLHADPRYTTLLRKLGLPQEPAVLAK